jgi:sporulation protein YlmC with PRC-barrel domain
VKKLASATVLVIALAVGIIPPLAAEEGIETLKTLPSDSLTVSDIYQQDVYDEQDKKIGSIKDILLDRGGQVTAVIVGIGGLLGVGTTDVAVPFKALRVKEKDAKRYLVLNATKEMLEGATSFTYDRDKHQWLAAEKETRAANGFAGVWKVKDSEGNPFEITLSADGSAKADRAGEGMSGNWKEEGGATVIKWDSGWTTKIAKEGNTYKKTAFDKGMPLDGPPTNSSDAEKVE